jgi:predicted acyl esterase
VAPPAAVVSGRFATFGPSYWGLARWALADGAPQDLVAMVAVLTSARLVRFRRVKISLRKESET